jgi:hypothetical protein
MLAALSRAWHSPRSGPVILVLAGLPLLMLAVGMLAFPLLLVWGVLRFMLFGGAPPFVGFAAWYPAAMALLWTVALGLALLMRRIARANRGLDVSIAIRPAGRAASALAVAKRLHAALAIAEATRGEPIREDYGAGFWLWRGADRFWLAVSETGEGGAAISLAYDAGPDLRARLTHRADRALFARLEAALRAAVAADPALQVAPRP